jgi:hypothetical protein
MDYPYSGTVDIGDSCKKGSCVVTDGPIIEFIADSNDHTAHMGGVLHISADGVPEMRIKLHTTPEFGQIQLAEVVTSFQGQDEKSPIITPVEGSSTETITFDGVQGYCCVQAQSIANGERFSCFTNPIWLCIPDDCNKTMKVSLDIIENRSLGRRRLEMKSEKHMQELSEDLVGEVPIKPGQESRSEQPKLPKPDKEMMDTVPAELQEAWIKYMISGYENNQKMFKRTLDAFMKPYNITILMYVVMFIVGILFFAMAIYLGFIGDQQLMAIGFGGLSVVSFVTFFIRQPVQALEENLEFICWLGVAFNTYWTRLMYISNKDTVQDEIKAATDDYSDMLERLIDKHAKLRARRAGKEITETESPPSNEETGTNNEKDEA